MLTPTVRRPWPIWVAVALFAVACTTAVTCFHPPRHESIAGEIRDIEKLAKHLQKANPDLHLFSVSRNDNLREGFYLSCRTLSRQDISHLIRQPGQKHRWQGVVLCQCHKSEAFRSDVAREIAEWGDGGLLLPDDISIVGDPKLVRRFALQR